MADIEAELLAIRGDPSVQMQVTRLRGLGSKHPRSAPVWLRLAHTALDARQFDVGLDALERALCLDLHTSSDVPGLVPEHLSQRIEALRYVSHLSRGPDREHELVALRRLSLLYPDFIPLSFNLAVTLMDGDPEEARKVAGRVIQQSPTMRDVFPPALLSGIKPAPPEPGAAADPMVGRAIGNYRVLGVRTAAPEVVLYDALDTSDHRPVTLRRSLHLANRSAERLFRDQLKAGGPRRHLPQVHAVIVADDGTPLQVLERIHGQSVWEAFATPPTDLDVALNLVWLAARAIHELHSTANYLHGRIGPSNVLLLDDNIERPILFLDSGLDLRRRAGGSLPAPYAPDSTPSPAADVFGLGLLLHYAMTGRLPADGKVDDAWLPSHPTGRAVRELIGRCIEPDLNARCRRAEEVAIKLETLYFRQPDALSTGSEIDEWRLVRPMSDDGTFAEVYEAVHVRDPRRKAAIKVLRWGLASNRELRNRFELEAAKTPIHPGIVRIHPRQSYVSHTQPYFAMEYLDGKSLREVIPHDGMPLAKVVTYALELADALSFAHGEGVVHRDLKPDNIMVLKHGGQRQTKVVDFGIAKIDVATVRTRMFQPMGTPAYMAPEQFAKPDQVKASADVYALGVILTHCVRGAHPGPNTDDYARWSAYHQHAPVVTPGEVTARGPQPASAVFEALLARMTAKEPSDRPTMAGVCDQLRALGEHLPGTPTYRTVVVPPPAAAAKEPTVSAYDNPYDRPITRANPAGILILIDESGSMGEPFGGDKKQTKRNAVMQVVNEYIDNLITGCLQADGTIFDYYFVRVLGFGGKEVRPLTEGWISTSRLDTLSKEVAPPGHSEPMPTWVEPRADGGTPGTAALTKALECLDEWHRSYPQSHPAVLFLISDGEFAESGGIAAKLRAMTPPPLVLCAHISKHDTTPELFPAALPGALLANADANTLWSLASVLPQRLRINLQRSLRHQGAMADDARGYMYNVTSPAHLKALFRGGTPRNQ